MTPRLVAVVGAFALAAAGVVLHAQDDAEAGRTFGVLFWHRSPNDFATLDGVRAALADRPGAPTDLWIRHADADEDRARLFLSEFDDAGVDVVISLGTQATLLARESSRSPVVFTAVTHPVESGIAESWDRVGGRLAGNSNWIDPATVLGVFREAVPGLRRLGLLRSSQSGVVSAAEAGEMRRHVARDDVEPLEIVEEVVDSVPDLRPAVRRLLERNVEALWIPIDFFVAKHIDQVLAVTRPASLPLVSSSVQGARSGAVAGVFADYGLLGQRAVALAEKVLSGVDPGSLPVGRVQSYRVVVNLSAAQQCGYELPLSLVVLADRILE